MASTTKNKHKKIIKGFIKILLPIVVIAFIWEFLALLVNDSYFLPNIKDTASALFGIITAPYFFSFLFTSLFRVLAGLIIGALLGIILAAFAHYFDFAEFIISPIMSIMKATPVACIIVLLWISMNYTQLTVFIVSIMVLPIIYQNVSDGYKSISKDLYEVCEIFKLSYIKRIRILIIPALLPYIIPAIITSIGLAWKAEIAAEIMTNSNIGELIFNFKTQSFDTASIFAWTAIIILLSILLEKGTKYLLRRFINEPDTSKHK